jgi:hypothetical protein
VILIMTEEESRLYEDGEGWVPDQLYHTMAERAGRLAPQDEPVIVETLDGQVAFGLPPVWPRR